MHGLIVNILTKSHWAKNQKALKVWKDFGGFLCDGFSSNILDRIQAICSLFVAKLVVVLQTCRVLKLFVIVIIGFPAAEF